MARKCAGRLGPLSLALLLAACAPAGDADAGRSIFRLGIRADGSPVRATIAGADVEGALVACARCHGARAEGHTEGGVHAPALGPRSASFRAGLGALRRALEAGRGRGRPLDPAMPRYRLRARDAADLRAYLARVDTDPEVGVDDREIRVGLVAPSGDEARTIAAAFVEAGRVYCRRLRLQIGPSIPAVEGTTIAVIDRASFAGQPLRLLVPPENAAGHRITRDRATDCEALRIFAARHRIDLRDRGRAHEAWALARALEEALRRAGANPTRPALRDALDGLWGFDAGCGARVEFDAAPPGAPGDPTGPRPVGSATGDQGTSGSSGTGPPGVWSRIGK